MAGPWRGSEAAGRCHRHLTPAGSAAQPRVVPPGNRGTASRGRARRRPGATGAARAGGPRSPPPSRRGGGRWLGPHRPLPRRRPVLHPPRSETRPRPARRYEDGSGRPPRRGAPRAVRRGEKPRASAGARPVQPLPRVLM